MNENPLIEKQAILEKFPGKGGWTFVRVHEIPANKKTPFGWVRVRGKIDGYELKSYNLQSMGNSLLFLPIKAEIRKIIKKKEGDLVHIVLFEDNLPIEIPEELKICMMDEPGTLETFMRYTFGEQKTIIDWIYSAKKEDTKIERIVQTIRKIEEQMSYKKM